MSVDLGPFIFITDFDSSNLHSVELIPRQGQQESFNFHAPDYEVNVWTKPDCCGTTFQNGNRTWFHFGVKGGRSSGMIKFNILNLNKQVKLFLQGMQPVYRYLPHKPLWDRVRDKLVVNEKEEHVCSISFRQRLSEDSQESVLYLAFTYPFSYIDLSEWLSTVDSTYSETTGPGCIPFESYGSLSQSRAETILSRSFSRENEIYYHRECACFSLEGRRVELITLTSLHGMSNEREQRLFNLFPILEEERPFRFPGKKVIFLSARVHPGETPSTFVLNGVFKFLLEPRDPRAIILRRLFVFKFMPMLNPDGVSRGHYRTDPRGINLNRVYLQPSPVLHPTIYAAKKLVLYYHNGKDSPDDYKYETEYNSNKDCADGKSILKENYSSAEETDPTFTGMTPNTSTTMFSTKLIDSPSAIISGKTNVIKSSLCAGCVTVTSSSNLESKKKSKSTKSRELDSDTCSRLNEDSDVSMSEVGSGFHSEKLETFLVESEESHQCTFESCDEDSLVDISDVKTGKSITRLAFDSSQCSIEMAGPSNKLTKSIRPSRQRERKINLLTEKEDHDIVKSSVKSTGLQHRKKRSGKLKQRNSSTSVLSPPLSYKTANVYSESKSGLFLYIDMHGHATKRGIFMYGNHFNDPLVQSECMLLPRLMAMNCQHFDFSACNFTERLMNMKDRRDGASREGSGRVAVLKHTGLVRSYTLECNYNTGRLVNHVMNRPSSFGFNDPPMNPSPHPPKFTPDLFEAKRKAK